MTARELYEYLRERNAEDLPLLTVRGYEGYDYLSDLDISIYDDGVQLG